MAQESYFYALGRRKSSTAQVRITQGKGVIVINNKSAEEYFNNSKTYLYELQKPFFILDQVNKFDASVKVKGGGHASQVDAVRLGIARALASFNSDLKSTLKRADMLGRDPREKERKKFGLKGARKQRQFTKR